MSFGPEKIDIKDVFINSIGSFIAGVIGSILMLLIVVFTSSFLDVVGRFEQAQLGFQTSAIFPIFVSIIALIGTSLSVYLSYLFLYYTSAEKYRKSLVIFGQLSFFIVFIYFLITPLYILQGLSNFENVMYLYIIHIFLLSFGTSLLIEVLNKYRYVLIGIYGTFLGLFVSAILTFYVFSSFSGSFAKLIVLLTLLPTVNFLTTFFKYFFEFIYFQYHRMTNLDQMGDIFYQIEQEEKEALREEEEKNRI